METVHWALILERVFLALLVIAILATAHSLTKERPDR